MIATLRVISAPVGRFALDRYEAVLQHIDTTFSNSELCTAPFESGTIIEANELLLTIRRRRPPF